MEIYAWKQGVVLGVVELFAFNLINDTWDRKKITMHNYLFSNNQAKQCLFPPDYIPGDTFPGVVLSCKPHVPLAGETYLLLPHGIPQILQEDRSFSFHFRPEDCVVQSFLYTKEGCKHSLL